MKQTILCTSKKSVQVRREYYLIELFHISYSQKKIVLNSIGSVYFLLGEFDLALNSFNTALECERVLLFTSDITFVTRELERVSNTLLNIGRIYVCMGCYIDALIVYEEAFMVSLFLL